MDLDLDDLDDQQGFVFLQNSRPTITTGLST